MKLSLSLKVRVLFFVLAIALGLGAVIWKAHSSWQRINWVRNQLAAAPSDSFHVMRRFQLATFRLNNILLHYGIDKLPAEWAQFTKESGALDAYIDERKLLYTSEKERRVLNAIDTAHTNYMMAAEDFYHAVRDLKQGTNQMPLIDFNPVQQASEELNDHGYQLADARILYMQNLFNSSDRLLRDLGILLLSTTVVVIGLGAWLAVIAYHRKIAPLQLKLVESRSLLERQEKLASLGMLAAGVAHEIRNPLTAIKARLFTLKRLLPANSPEQTDAETINQQIDRLERIVKDFLLFARPSDPERTITGAEVPLREVHKLLSPQLKKSDIQLQLELAGPAWVEIDVQQIQQVLINLVQNAADAIGQNGAITLRLHTGAKRLDNRLTEVVILEVRDTGGGIPPDIEQRLFDPFFTTKQGGSGLGLSIAARIVEKHGGALLYQTEQGIGTTFGIVLPRIHEPETQA